MTEVEQSAAPQNGIDLSAAEDDDNSKARPADIEQDMREMERRKRVEAIMGSKLFREELERIVDSAREGGTTSGILQQLSDIVGIPCTRVGSVFKASNCMMPINDIRGVESMGYAKGEKILRCKLAATFRLLDLYGWTQGLGAQITARLKVDQEYFLVNPYGMMYHEITASSLNKVDMQGHIVEQGTTNFGVNKSHFVLHSIVHAARPDIRCAIYIGCSPVVAVSSLKSGILPLTKDACVLGEITTHAYTGSLDGEERDKLVRSLGPNSKVMLLSNHGALCCGETIEEAFYSACHIVQACETQLKLLPVGLDNLVLIPEESRKQIYEQSRRPPEDLEKKFAAAVSTQQSTDENATEHKEETVAPIKATGNIPKWRVGGAEFEALMRMLDNAGYRTGYIYRHPLVKSDPPKPKNDVELPPAVSSLGYLLEEEELFKQGIWKKGELRKGGDRSRWLNSPNVYQKVEVLETGTPDPKKITKWVAEGSPTHSTPVRIEDPLQFVPAGTNPKEFKRVQQQIKDNRRADKISAGPQSHILEGVTWDEANRIKDATVSQAGDHVVLMGAASKGIIQRGFQHNAAVYKAPYAKNPFDNVTDDELNEYKRTVERKKKSIHGEYTDTDFSESEALSSQQTSGAQHTKQTTTTTTAQAVSQSEPEDISEHQVMRIETQQAPVPSQPEVVLSDATLSFINGERSHTATNRKPPTGREQNKNFNFKQVNQENYVKNVVAAAGLEADDANKENIYQVNQHNIHNPNTPDKLQATQEKIQLSANSSANANANFMSMTMSSSSSANATTPTIWHSMRSTSSYNNNNNNHTTTTSSLSSTNNFTAAAFNCTENNNLNRNGCVGAHGCIGVGNIVLGKAYGTPTHNLLSSSSMDGGMRTFQPSLLCTADDLTSTRYYMHPSPPTMTQSCNNIFQYSYPSLMTNARPLLRAGTSSHNPAFAFAAQQNELLNATAFDCASNVGAGAYDVGASGAALLKPIYSSSRSNKHAQQFSQPENAYKKSIFCRTPQLCDYIFEALQHKSSSSSSDDGNNLIYNIPFRIEGGSGSTTGCSTSMPVTPTTGNSPHKSRCGTPKHKRRPPNNSNNGPSSPYRTVSHFGFNSPQRLPKPEHKHIPREPKKYVALRRSVSYEEIFSSPRYIDLCENCFERLVRIKPELLQLRSRLRNIYDLPQPREELNSAADALAELQRDEVLMPTADQSMIKEELYVTTEADLYSTAFVEFDSTDADSGNGAVPPFALQLPPVLEEDELIDSSATTRSSNSAAANATITNSTFIGKILQMNFSNESTNVNYAATTPHTISSNITIDLDATQYHTEQASNAAPGSIILRTLSPTIVSPHNSVHSLHAVRECTNFVREQQRQQLDTQRAQRSLRSSPGTISLNAFTELEMQLLQEQPAACVEEILDTGNWPAPLPQTDDEGEYEIEDTQCDPTTEYTECGNGHKAQRAGREEHIRRKLEFNEMWDDHVSPVETKQVKFDDADTEIIKQNDTENIEVQKEIEDDNFAHSDTESLNNVSTTSTVSETFYSQTLIQRQRLFQELPGVASYQSIDPELDSISSQHSLTFINSAMRNQLDGIEALLKHSISSSDSYEESDNDDDNDYVYNRRTISSGFLNVIIEESEEEDEEEIEQHQIVFESGQTIAKSLEKYEMLNEQDENSEHLADANAAVNVEEMDDASSAATYAIESTIDELVIGGKCENKSDVPEEREFMETLKDIVQSEANHNATIGDQYNDPNRELFIYETMEFRMAEIELATIHEIAESDYEMAGENEVGAEHYLRSKSEENLSENDSVQEVDGSSEGSDCEMLDKDSDDEKDENYEKDENDANDENDENYENDENDKVNESGNYAEDEKVNVEGDGAQNIPKSEDTKMYVGEGGESGETGTGNVHQLHLMAETEEEREINATFATAIDALEAEEYAASDNEDESQPQEEEQEQEPETQKNVLVESGENAENEELGATALMGDGEDGVNEVTFQSSDSSLSQEDYEDNDENDDADIDAPFCDDDDLRGIRLRHRVLKRKFNQTKINLNGTDDTDNTTASDGGPVRKQQAHSINFRKYVNVSSDADDEQGDDSLPAHTATETSVVKPTEKEETAQEEKYVNEKSIIYVNLLQQRPLETDGDVLDLNLLFEDSAESSIDTACSTTQQRYIDSDTLLTAVSSPCERLALSITEALDFEVGGAPLRAAGQERLAGGCEIYTSSASKEQLINLSQQVGRKAGLVARRVHDHLASTSDSLEGLACACFNINEQLLGDMDAPSNDGSGDGIPRIAPAAKGDEQFFRDLSLESAKTDQSAGAFTLCRTDCETGRFFSDPPALGIGAGTQMPERQEIFSMDYVYNSATQQAELKFMEFLPTLPAANAKCGHDNESDEMLTYNIPLVAEQFELYSQQPIAEFCYESEDSVMAAEVMQEKFENTTVSLLSPTAAKTSTPCKPSEGCEEFDNTTVSLSSPTRQASEGHFANHEQFHNTTVSLSSPTCQSSEEREEFYNTAVSLTPNSMKSADREDFFNTTLAVTSPSRKSADCEQFDSTIVSVSSSTRQSADHEDFCNTTVSVTSHTRPSDGREEYANTSVTLSPARHLTNGEQLQETAEVTEYFGNTLVTVKPPQTAELSNAYLTPLEQKILYKIKRNGLAQENEIFKKIEMTIRNKLTPSKMQELLRKNCPAEPAFSTPKRQAWRVKDKQAQYEPSVQCAVNVSNIYAKELPQRQLQQSQYITKRLKNQNKTPQKQWQMHNIPPRSPLRTSRAINITVSNSPPMHASDAPRGNHGACANMPKKRNFIRENIRNASKLQKQQIKRLQKATGDYVVDKRNHNVTPPSPGGNNVADVYSFQSKVVRGSPSFWVSLPKSPACSPRTRNGQLVRTHRKPSVKNSQINQMQNDVAEQSESALDTSSPAEQTETGDASAELELCAKDSTVTLKGETLSDDSIAEPATHVDNEIAAFGAELNALQPRLDNYKQQIDNFGDNIAHCAQCLDDCIHLQQDIAQQHFALCNEMRLQQYAADINCQAQTYAIDAADD